ncbi:RecQ family ATP-dependent DNA helicase [Salinicola aestuarinus]|uniref:RecQ family ATP-dependent DNA helicase n=1 Tax=Salinicola aestuarinus TaxID=1949082 RepID=UPI000DA15C61|nr:RecQ family ATP-dependent DNA helicase [Salinicola aestuarinus]
MTHTARDTLQRVFGFDDFRGGQGAVVERVIAGRSTAAIFATGAGKSLCYQLPALHLPHLTLVVSPLLALMHDQLAFLQRHGISAASLDSTQDRDTSRDIMERARQGELKILMVSVERLKNERFRHFLRRVDISLLVIDEAHCISEWGHNFRPDYLKLPDYQREFGIPQALLLTATATPAVIGDMREKFAIAESDVITTGFYRSNLELLVEPVPAERRVQALTEWLSAPPTDTPSGNDAPDDPVFDANAPTIVYVTLQQTAESVANALAGAGFAARAYHAGLDAETREAIQQGFMAGDIPCIVATIAFGMGIDKGDIRRVIHYDLPKSIENYSQEIGRAGRDGKRARCLTLAGRDGLRVLENFVYGDTPERQGIRHVLEEIAAAGRQPDRQWPVLLNTLSKESNVRLLALKTLLVRLEMLGVIAPRFAFLAEYRLRYVEASETLIQRFEGERADFVRLIVDNIPVARTWGTVDFDRLFRAGEAAGIDASRARVITALEYFQEKGWVVLEGKRMTDVFEVREPDADIETLTDTLTAEGDTFERREIERLAAMLQLFESETCLSRRLAEYFGDDRLSTSSAPQGCGHCSVCYGRIARLPPPPPQPAPSDSALAAMLNPFIARHREQQGIAPSDKRMAHFLCGLPMPVFTPLKARSLDGFASLEQYAYPQVRQWTAAFAEL